VVINLQGIASIIDMLLWLILISVMSYDVFAMGASG